MSKVKVLVRDRNTLVLDEDAKQGDIICLNELTEIDYSEIEQIIEEGKDKVYKQHLLEHEQTIINAQKAKEEERVSKLEKEYLTKINELNSQITSLNTTIKSFKENQALALTNKEQEVEKKYISEIASLKAEIKEINKTKEKEIIDEKNKIIDKYNVEMKSRQKDLDHLKEIHEKEMSNLQLQAKAEKEKELAELSKTYQEQLTEKDNAINELTRRKASSNVKQIGEDLEVWCNNEVTSYMQNGLFNCLWQKDNKVVKDEDEIKGSKADYIFKVFADESKSVELTSICLDMKDENPDSVNKKSNADYYKALDKNRTKKSCKYAVLVSTLEMEHSSYLPMYRVSEYPDMYVVRPAYLMTFLNMITSLTMKFADQILKEEKEKLEYKSAIELMNEFDSLKNTYLDKPLKSLNDKVEGIMSQNGKIIDAAGKIADYCNDIIGGYMNDIVKKLEKFEVNIKKAYKKVD